MTKKEEFEKKFWSEAVVHTNADVDKMWSWIENEIREAKVEGIKKVEKWRNGQLETDSILYYDLGVVLAGLISELEKEKI